jgi:hypothetical protein
LCANLPIVYGVLARAAKSAAATMNRSDRITTDGDGYRGPSRGSLYHDWRRLNRSGSIAGESSEANPGLSIKEAHTAALEMDSLAVNGNIAHGLKLDV